jgi:sugar phosphate isomerase/epimerase
MQFGVCGNPDVAGLAAQAGFDYFEWGVGPYLAPREAESAFEQSLAWVRAAALPCPAVNVFVPADLKITGPEADLEKLSAYVGTACRRAAQGGVRVIVFGSGGARRVPAGFDRAAAWQQLVDFCAVLGPAAAQHGVTAAVEPLNRAECNILTSAAECAQLVRQVNHPGVRLLVDAFHMLRDDDPFAAITANADLLAHVHVATRANRLAPGMEDCPELDGFFAALRASGYAGRVSIEAALPADLPGLTRSLEMLRAWAG